jgi:serine/threonine protein kinase
MAIEAGTRAGKYELGQQLGAGGFGLVFLARDHELGRDCALKFLLPQHTGNTDHVQRFLQEARAAARIQHAGIVTVFECGQFPPTGSGTDGMVYIAMELLRGESLAARVKRGALPVAGAVAIARQIASAVGAAHQIGIVHRDLKPENVYLVPDPETVSGERVKVLDFGIAKLGEASSASAVHTGTYTILGSPRYMSPEQCRSTARVDARTDIYSLGVMLFEMLCGERPFVDPDLGVLIAKHQVVEPPRIGTKVAGLPAGLDELVARMLAKSPEERPQSMEVVQRVLEPFRGSTAQEVSRRAAAADAADPFVATQPVVTDPAVSPRRPPPGSPAEVPSSVLPTELVARRRSSAFRWALGGGLVVVAAAGIGWIATRAAPAEQQPAEQRSTQAAAGAPSRRLPTPQELRDHHRATVARRDAAALGAALAPAVYAMGPDATELAHGASAARALIGKHIDQIPIGPRGAPIGRADDVTWWIEIGGDRQLASSTIAIASGHEWRVAVWKLAYLVPNLTAAKLAAAGRLPVPAEVVPLSDPAAAEAPAAAATFRAAMSSRGAFVAAFSTRDDAIATGTAPGELIIGGRAVRTAFARLKSEFALRGEIAAGRIADRAAWAAANIDYTTAGYTPQIFRVLALLLREDERWTLALAHFSNAGPIGKP